MRKEEWFITTKRADFYALAEELDISPVLARLIRNRDIEGADAMRRYLHGGIKDLHDPCLLKDALKGAGIIRDKIREGKKIRIISDYDVDGVASNYILYAGLSRCGADVDYQIPDREEDGYGINIHLIDQALEDGVDTIITCDNGIAAAPQVAYGNEKGMTFVITDHHELPFELEDGRKKEIIPPAAAVINPKQGDCPYPYKDICGAVVAWKFVQVLYSLFDYPGTASDSFLQMAALATSCDVMPLEDENRIIVKEGLSRMNRNPIPGLKALAQANKISGRIRNYHLSFKLGPCINASGRLATAKTALKLLLCEEPAVCDKIAAELIALNEERKELTEDGVKAAGLWVEETGCGEDKVLVVHLPDCNPSVAGIIATRIRDKYYRPTFVIAGHDDIVKGSGRSIEPYHMHQEMTRVKECFEKFGGHPMAAGFSMRKDRIDELRRKLNAGSSLTGQELVKKIKIDIALPVDYLSIPLIEEFDLLEPCGKSNPQPLFAQKGLYITRIYEFSTGNGMKLNLMTGTGHTVDAVWFGEPAGFYQAVRETAGKDAERELTYMRSGRPHRIIMDCTYQPSVNEWRGERTIQIRIKNVRFHMKTGFHS